MDTSSTADNTSVYTLPDGRSLSYAIWGDRNTTRTVFYHHGFPSSHDEAIWSDEAARAHGIRVVAPDRPGMGRSTFQPDRRILDWPADLLALADHLGVGRFAVLGVSGGGPYVLACWHKLPRTRCAGVGILCGLYPASLGLEGMLVSTRLMLYLAQWSTVLVSGAFDLFVGRAARNAEKPEQLGEMFASLMASRPKGDRDAWERDALDMRKALTEGLRGAFLNRGRGAAWETYLNGAGWGFDLRDITAEPGQIVMWHGGTDVNVPVAMAEKAAKLIDNAELRVSRDESHCSIIVERAEEVMQTLNKMLIPG